MGDYRGTVWNGKRYVPGYSGMTTDLYREVLQGKRPSVHLVNIAKDTANDHR
jgi:hypothetical protein